MRNQKECLRCHYVDGVCPKCQRVKGQPKGAPRQPPITITGQTGVVAEELAPLNFDGPPEMSQQERAGPSPSAEPVLNGAAAPSEEVAPTEAAPPSDASEPSTLPDTAQAVAEARPTCAAAATEQSAPPPAAISVVTPEHSPIGGSAAERYLRCSGSVELLKLVRPDDSEEEWTVEGTNAHKLAAMCLEGKWPDPFIYLGQQGYEWVTGNMCLAVGTYLDYVRSRPGHMLVEHKMHVPEIHEQFFSTLDCALYSTADGGPVEIIDYKNGAGVIVEIVGNAQLLFYAAGFLVKHGPYPPRTPVRLTIVQPNAWHADGQIRSWETTAGDIMHWLHNELVPGIEATQAFDGWFFDMGEHCRFCPAKIACPAFVNLKQKVLARGITSYEEIELLQMLIKQWRKDAFARLQGGEAPELVGAKLVYGKANRVWKPEAEAALLMALGSAAYTVPQLISPAQVEELPSGKALVAQWAYKPEGSATIASINDGRTAAPSNLGSQVWGGEHMQKALASSPQQ